MSILTFLDVFLPLVITGVAFYLATQTRSSWARALLATLGLLPLSILLLETAWFTRHPHVMALIASVSTLPALLLLASRMHRKTETTHEIVHHHLHEAIFRASERGRLLYANQAFLRLFGFSSLAELNRHDLGILYADPEERQQVWNELSTFLQIKNRIVRFRRKDGTTFWGLLNSNFFIDEKTGEGLSDGSILDITPYRTMEQKLQQAHEALVAGFRALPVGIARLDEDAHIVQANPAFCDLFNVDEAELHGKTLYTVLASLCGETEETLRAVTRLKATQNTRRTLTLELTLPNYPEQPRYFRLLGNPVFDGHDSFLYFILLIEDITAQRMAEQAELQRRTRLSKQHKLLHHLVRNLKSTPSLQAFFQLVTETVAQLLEVERVSIWLYTNREKEVILCKDLYLLTEHTHHEGETIPLESNPAYFQALEEGVVVHADNARTHPATSGFETYLKAHQITSMLDAPIWLEGNVVGVICLEATRHLRTWLPEEELFISNVAEIVAHALNMRALEEARARAEAINRIKTSVLDNLSHEVRTPLTGILGFAEILRDEITEEMHREFIENIYANGQRLLHTLTTLLELSRLESDNAEVHPSEMEIVEETRRLVEDVRDLALSKGLSIHFMPEEPTCTVRTDRSLFTLALKQLLDNAIKFTREGTITLRLYRRGEHVCVEIRDTGIGMDEAFVPLMFEAFTQESMGLTRSFEGMGMGLLLVKRAVEKLGGTITVQTEKGRGSCFTIQIPSSSGTPSLPPHGTASPLPILVVEDNPSIRTYLRYLLTQRGLPVHLAETAEEARRHLKTYQYGLILMDIHLGNEEKAGEHLLKEIQTDVRHTNTPVVALTAYAMPGDRTRFLDIGFAHYLAKPFTTDTLFMIVDQYYPPEDPQSPRAHPAGADTYVSPN